MKCSNRCNRPFRYYLFLFRIFCYFKTKVNQFSRNIVFTCLTSYFKRHQGRGRCPCICFGNNYVCAFKTIIWLGRMFAVKIKDSINNMNSSYLEPFSKFQFPWLTAYLDIWKLTISTLHLLNLMRISQNLLEGDFRLSVFRLL